MATAKVLNGEVQAGDRVAYATRQGSWMQMNIATVLIVGDGLKVKVDQTSGFRFSDRPVWLSELDRVVKL